MRSYTNERVEQCRDKRRTVVDVPCLECGKTFTAIRTEVARGRSKFCSVSCKGKAGARASMKSGPAPCGREGSKNFNWKDGISKHPSYYARRFEKKYPHIARAHRLVRQAIRNGTLVRLPCEVCATVLDVHAHHEDYDRPLDVRWLCGKHHRIEHGASC